MTIKLFVTLFILLIIIAMAFNTWDNYKRSVINFPQELKEFGKIFPILKIMDEKGSFTVAWKWRGILLDWDPFKNKGNFKKGFMYGPIHEHIELNEKEYMGD